MKLRLFMTAAGLCLVSSAVTVTSALALDAHVTKDTAGMPADVWAAVGDFCGISTWHPAVAKCEISAKDGATFRTLTLKDGAKLLERQTAFDAKAMTYSYTIEEGPLPVANYKSTLKVVAGKDKGATIDWSGSFDAKGATDADAIKTISGIYAGGIDALVSKTSK
jgi:Polyketide cyclase / dehydrase and lipid transport